MCIWQRMWVGGVREGGHNTAEVSVYVTAMDGWPAAVE